MLFQAFNDLRMKNMADRLFRSHILGMLLGFSLFGSSSHETPYAR